MESANLQAYSIKFKTIKDIHIEVLIKAIQYGFETSNDQNVQTNNKENQ